MVSRNLERANENYGFKMTALELKLKCFKMTWSIKKRLKIESAARIHAARLYLVSPYTTVPRGYKWNLRVPACGVVVEKLACREFCLHFPWFHPHRNFKDNTTPGGLGLKHFRFLWMKISCLRPKLKNCQYVTRSKEMSPLQEQFWFFSSGLMQTPLNLIIIWLWSSEQYINAKTRRRKRRRKK